MELPRIRTYAADLSEEMRERKTTLSSIISAERTAKRAAPEVPVTQPEKRRNIFLIAAAGGLVLLGIAAVLIAFMVRPDNTAPVVTESMIFANERVTIDTVTEPLSEALTAHRANDPLSLGEIEDIRVMASGIPMSPSALAEGLGLPNAFAREVTEIMVGIHAFDHTQPFVIARVTAYDRAFNALLAAEPDLGRTLGTFFAPTGAASSAPTLSFSDAIVRNLDVRVSPTSWPIMYSFPSQNLLILTTNEYTLREVVTRLASSR